jgi:DNA-binding MarR family transcriptional regulator
MNKDNIAEVQKRKRILENCTCMHIRRSSRAVTQYYDAVLAPSGISSSQLTLLATISLDQLQSLKQVADRIGMTPSSLTHMLKPMFEQDLVENEIGTNKKTKHLVLTDRGMRTLKLATPLWECAQEELVAKIGERDWQDLIDKLAVVSQVPTVIAD